MLNGKTLRSYDYAIILTGSLFLGVLWVAIVDTQPVSDFAYYHRLAQSIAKGGQWGDTYTTVGYPVLLALFYKVFGASLWVAKGLNLSLSFLNNLLVLAILKRTTVSERGRKIIFALFALFPSTIFYNSVVGTEILFTTILLALTLLYLSEVKYKYVLMGILVGLGTLIKPFFIAYFLAIFLAEFLSKRRLGPSLRHGLLVLVMSLLVLAPWLYRNYLLIGESTWVSNNGGIVLYINNNSQNHSGRWMPAEDVENSLVNTSEYSVANATEKNKMLSQAAKAWIVSHPWEFVSLGLKRLANTFDSAGGDMGFSFYGSSVSGESQKLLYHLTRIVSIPVYRIGVFSILGFSLRFLLRFGKEKISSFESYLLVLFYMFAGIYFLTEGQSRYAFPTLFILVYFFYSLPKLLGLGPERNI